MTLSPADEKDKIVETIVLDKMDSSLISDLQF